MQNFFALFRLEPKFNLDLNILETHYRTIQSATHPDRFVSASAAEKLAAMQAATYANEAYQTLKHPTLRGTYLLKLQGIVAISDNNTTMPTDFLLQQIEWREIIEDHANNLSGLHHVMRELKQHTAHLQQVLTTEIDQQQNWTLAADTLRKLQFMDKLREEINRKIEALED